MKPSADGKRPSQERNCPSRPSERPEIHFHQLITYHPDLDGLPKEVWEQWRFR